MAGPVLYEASVPFFRKALQNQLQILKQGEVWCRENNHDISVLTKATLGTDGFGLPFHVQFCTYNAVQLLIDLGIVETESLSLGNDEQSMEELISRVEQSLKLLDQAVPAKFADKESKMIDVNMGALFAPQDRDGLRS